MYIAIPREITGLDELVSNIDCSDIRAIQFVKTHIKLSLPKFKILHTTKLNEILKSVSILCKSHPINLSHPFNSFFSK